MEKEYDYKQEESDVFGSVKRPRIELQIYLTKKNRWIWVDEILADTGADFCMLPRYFGNFFVEDITSMERRYNFAGDNEDKLLRGLAGCQKNKIDGCREG